MNIGERIRSCREAYGMSQAQLARALWVSRNTISNWETGATTPDIESFVLMSALFGISIDNMVKEDETVMASAIARDRNHLLALCSADEPATLRVNMPDPVDDPVLESYPAIDIAAAHAKGDTVRLRRVWAIFNAAHYRLEEGGRRIGSIHRGHALFFPYFSVRVDGFSRVMLRRDYHMEKGIGIVYRLEGENLSFEGNVLGPEFSVLRKDNPLVHIVALPTGARASFSLEIVDDGARQLGIGVALALLLMRDHDRNLVRNAGK